jgi:hypothetical protein
MTVDELFAELRKLDRHDKLRAVQLLVTELATETPALPAGEYEVWSPTDAADAAQALARLLDEDSRDRARADA